MTTLRLFTLEEANALIPRVSALVGGQLRRREAIEARLAELAAMTGVPPEGFAELPDDPPPVRALKHDLAARIHEYQATWNELESLGVVLKDARAGLVDFYSRVEGKVVCLCWRHGEDAIGSYHDVDAGFAGRKPLAGAVKARLYN